MDVIEAIHTRRSIRAYSSRPVDRDLIEQVIWDAAQAPPPYRGQMPWTFHVVEGAERIAGYGERAKRYARDNHADEPGRDWAKRPDFDIFWGAPVVVIISGPAGDCCRAGQNLLLAAHARGLGSCWVGSPLPWLHTAEAQTELGLPPDTTVGAVLCLGYPAIIPDPAPRARPTIVWVT